MLKAATKSPTPDTEVQKCIDALSEANKKGEIVGMSVALVGTINADTTQHIAGKYNVAMMLGSLAFLHDMVKKDTTHTSEDY